MSKANGILRGVLAALGTVAVVSFAFISWWFVTPTTSYLQPVSFAYTHTGQGLCGSVISESGWCARLVRETPRGEVVAIWTTEIRLLNDGETECSLSGRSAYQVVPMNAISYPVSHVMAACLDAMQPFHIVQEHSVLIGPISLRPTRIEATFYDFDAGEITMP
jgi:hypothetical protein